MTTLDRAVVVAGDEPDAVGNLLELIVRPERVMFGDRRLAPEYAIGQLE